MRAGFLKGAPARFLHVPQQCSKSACVCLCRGSFRLVVSIDRAALCTYLRADVLDHREKRKQNWYLAGFLSRHVCHIQVHHEQRARDSLLCCNQSKLVWALCCCMKGTTFSKHHIEQKFQEPFLGWSKLWEHTCLPSRGAELLLHSLISNGVMDACHLCKSSPQPKRQPMISSPPAGDSGYLLLF